MIINTILKLIFNFKILTMAEPVTMYESSIFSRDLSNDEKIEYFKNYFYSKFEYLNCDDVIYPPSENSDYFYVCQWVLDEDETVMYIVANNSDVFGATDCENVPVSLIVWNDDERDISNDFEVTKLVYEIRPYIEDTIGFYVFVMSNVYDKSSKNYHSKIIKKNIIKAETLGQCSICICDYEKDSNVTELSNCKHLFCTPCIETWLETSTSCPLCRTECI